MPWLGCALLRVTGWRIDGELPDAPKFVIAVAPHTSNWDFLYGAAVMFALDLRIAFLGKHTLFRGPFDSIMRWMGGVPVDRSSSHGVVSESIAAFRAVERHILAIAPEGTRAPGARFRSGFLRIARGAGVPVLLAALDYETKCVHMGPTIMTGPDLEADLQRIEAHFSHVKGRYPRCS